MKGPNDTVPADYPEMYGWPGTISPRRLRKALDAVRDGTPGEQRNRRVQADVKQLLNAHEANILSSQEPEESEAPGWEDLVLMARAGDTGLSIGGIMVWKETVTEERSIFRLLRHPEWMGLNRIMPLMEGMKVMVFESHHLAGRPGLILAETKWDEFERASGGEMPPGEPAFLGRILEWHGASEVRWIGG